VNEPVGVARTVFDSLYGAVHSLRLSWPERQFLTKHITPYSRSWSLSKALVQSALSKWPVTSTQAGVFAITRSEFIQDEIVDEILSRNGKSGLETILLCAYLPERARERIQRRLTLLKPEKGGNPWNWLSDE
jgi:hypothetical protein